jgi:DNA-damage-inducible protein J
MPATAEFHATLDRKMMEEASAIYAEAGITLADAFRLLIRRTISDQAPPLDLWVPNATTIEAMEAARRGDVIHVGSIDELFRELEPEE